MTTNEPTRPVEEGVDPSNERKVLDHLKKVDKDKKPTATGAEVKKSVRSQPTPSRTGRLSD